MDPFPNSAYVDALVHQYALFLFVEAKFLSLFSSQGHGRNFYGKGGRVQATLSS